MNKVKNKRKLTQIKGKKSVNQGGGSEADSSILKGSLSDQLPLSGLPKKRNKSYRQVDSARRLLGRTANLLEKSEISSEKAKALGYLASQLISFFKSSVYEDRLRRLEEQLENNKNNDNKNEHWPRLVKF